MLQTAEPGLGSASPAPKPRGKAGVAFFGACCGSSVQGWGLRIEELEIWGVKVGGGQGVEFGTIRVENALAIIGLAILRLLVLVAEKSINLKPYSETPTWTRVLAKFRIESRERKARLRFSHKPPGFKDLNIVVGLWRNPYILRPSALQELIWRNLKCRAEPRKHW